jgi:5-formyltetrahydrofolate cyclo-ligase
MVEAVTPDKKQRLRAAILAARSAVPAAVHAAEAQRLCEHVAGLVTPGITVCAYAPIGSEPGSVALLDELLRLGARVLLPVTRTDSDGCPKPLLWGEYRPGALVSANYGLKEPTGPPLTADALSGAAVVLVPALAVDHTGVRLGRGAGYYDRSLPLADPAAKLVAVVRDDELVDNLPAEPHDVAMTHALTPGGVVDLGM